MNDASAISINTGPSVSCDIFVTIDNDIYVDTGASDRRVEKWRLNETNGTSVMSFSSRCYSLFIDINNTLYCSSDSISTVVKTSLIAGTNISVSVAAGNGTQGSLSTLLYYPNGIFVDKQFNLYVADCGNNRVQRFALDQLSGATVAGVGASGTIDLHWPTDVILDGDDFLFIVDTYNNRIVGSGPDGFRCIVGCLGGGGTAPSQLNQPRSLAFDSEGNLFVVDSGNGRIQKFQLATNTCSKSAHRHSQFDKDRKDILHHVAEGDLCAARMKARVYALTSPTLHTLNSPSTSPASRLSS